MERLLILVFLAIPAIGWANDNCEKLTDGQEESKRDVVEGKPVAIYRQIPGSKFVAVIIPEAGRVESTSGRVQFNSTGEGWLKLPVGYIIGDKQKILIGAGAELTLRFSECEVLDLEPAPVDRFIELQLNRSGDDT